MFGARRIRKIEWGNTYARQTYSPKRNGYGKNGEKMAKRHHKKKPQSFVLLKVLSFMAALATYVLFNEN